MKKAVIIGAGRIGRGFVTELLLKNGYEVVFFEASDEMIEKLNSAGSYTIHVLGHEELDTKVENVRAFSINDPDTLAQEWETADLVFASVGGKNIPFIGKALGQAFKKLCKDKKVKITNIITCENWIDPSKILKESLLNELDSSEQELFLKNTGVSESVVMATGTGSPNSDEQTNEMDTWVQNMWYLPVDREKITGPLPELKYITFVESFGNLLQQKLYTFNASVALIAFLGRLKGYTYVGDAANDPDIEKILDKEYEEIQKALVNGMGVSEESQKTLAKQAKSKYQDKEIVDALTRVARDPIRKLGPTDRLIGPARLALDAGEKPVSIALAIAAALYYEDENDSSAVKLKEMRESKGIDYILENISMLKKDEPLTGIVKEAIEDLKTKGWIK
jgi:mannitol-1-phosphate 5-dehydrogenase